MKLHKSNRIEGTELFISECQVKHFWYNMAFDNHQMLWFKGLLSHSRDKTESWKWGTG